METLVKVIALVPELKSAVPPMVNAPAVPVILPDDVTERAAVMLTAPPKVTDPELVTVKVAKLLESPEPSAARDIAPVPASRINVSAPALDVPSVVPVTVMSPAPVPVEIVGVVALPIVKAPLKFRSP